MSKKRRSSSPTGRAALSKTRQNIGIGLLALIVVLLGVVAIRPGTSAVTPEMTAAGKAANAELEAKRKAARVAEEQAAYEARTLSLNFDGEFRWLLAGDSLANGAAAITPPILLAYPVVN